MLENCLHGSQNIRKNPLNQKDPSTNSGSSKQSLAPTLQQRINTSGYISLRTM